jgi:hypothetical protein
MTRFKRADITKVKTLPIRRRKSKVGLADFGGVFNGRVGSFNTFVKSLPRTLAAADLRLLVDQILSARKRGLPVILMMGAHVVKVGLGPVIIGLVRHKIITAVAMNSAAAIHDVETAMWGKTSEDVAETILDGSFGMARETGLLINSTLTEAFRTSDMGYGEALGRKLIALKAPHAKASILASCSSLNVPVTVHAAIGTDTVHQQPTMDGAATGELSFRDFRTFAELCKGLRGGGVVLNVGSAVIMPEVFLKALTVARNLGAKAKGFTTAVFDLYTLYRPTVNVKQRPTQGGGKGFYFIGHHEIMIPLLAGMISSRRATPVMRRKRQARP